MIFLFDFDQTLVQNNHRYEDSQPIPEMVELVQDLYTQGHIIKIYTARGASRFPDNKLLAQLTYLTQTQLKNFEIPYHELLVGVKPMTDIIIDDKSINPLDYNYNKDKIQEQIDKLLKNINKNKDL